VWRSEPPDQAGFYWFRFPGDATKVVEVNITRGLNYEYWRAWFPGSDVEAEKHELTEGQWWYPPLISPD
jgi:hypothetical protein